MKTQTSNLDKCNKAAAYLNSSWDGKSCTYSRRGKIITCEDQDEMLDLYDLLNDSDPDIVEDAFEIWHAAHSGGY